MGRSVPYGTTRPFLFLTRWDSNLSGVGVRRLSSVEIRHLGKVFPGVIANDDVNLMIQSGEIHAILGENGAGKSTLIKMISGLYQPDSGEILIDGVRQRFDSPRAAIRAGIGVVHQHFMLIPALTVAENVVLGSEPGRIRFDRRRAENLIREISVDLGLPVDPAARVSDLSVGMQQRIEIVKALYRKARILILDEPTAVLTPAETRDLFVVMRKLRAEGIPIIFISHKLEEVREIADTVTVMRAGRTVQTRPVEGTTAAELANWMVGRDVILSDHPPATAATGDVILQVDGLSVQDERKVQRVSQVSFAIRAGEIFGIAGIDGNGQTELVEALAGLRAASGGDVTFQGTSIIRTSVQARVAAGIGYVPQDRQRDGLVLSFTLTENMMLRDVGPPFSRRSWLLRKVARAQTESLIKAFDVRPPNPDALAGSLSGGNQQKVILAREVARAPRLLIAVQPTRGLDVGAIEGIHRELLRLRDAGSAILLVSLELDEIMALANRIAVMHAGRFVTTVERDAADLETIGLAMTGELAPHEEVRS